MLLFVESKLMPMNSGEKFYVIETDSGNGWTKIRRCDNSKEGFVPTEYIQCTLFPEKSEIPKYFRTTTTTTAYLHRIKVEFYILYIQVKRHYILLFVLNFIGIHTPI